MVSRTATSRVRSPGMTRPPFGRKVASAVCGAGVRGELEVADVRELADRRCRRRPAFRGRGPG
jgi:hypothetical protein